MTEHSKLNGRDRLKETIFSIMVSPKVTNGTLLFLRCFVSFMMLTHAFAKISNFDTLLNFFPTPFGMSRAMALSMITVIELGGSILLIFGFGSRLALLGLIAGMCTAAFFSFHPFEISRSELPMMYLGIYITLFFTGAGKYSIDYFIVKMSCKRQTDISIL